MSSFILDTFAVCLYFVDNRVLLYFCLNKILNAGHLLEIEYFESCAVITQ